MIRTDLHIHTTYGDGRNTPEEMVLSAITMGMERIGFSEHSSVPFDPLEGMTGDNVRKYIDEISGLKEKYRGRIEILCGIEQDFYSEQDVSAFDYVIGSVHYLEKDGAYFAVDDTPDILEQALADHYAGDSLALAEDYFSTVSLVADKTGADIIGHFDLITKFCEKAIKIETDDPAYISAWQRAADRLLPLGKPFEINTGAVSRGWRSAPYPDMRIIEYIREHGGRFILSSDSHSSDTIAFGFDRFEFLL
ncbi:MAG: histidinol-phosphatase [Oscillospiraceae bacterium]|nr:histidinol-phosphatase [Oscillospiraceae bacterium]